MFSLLAAASSIASADFTATFIHTNDLHAHVEGGRVNGEMLGGYARHATLIKQLKKDSPNPILLNGGDVFQGTLYFNTYLGLADLAYMEYVGYDAMAVGNHEFDRGPATLAAFIKSASFPVLSSNIDATEDPDLKGLIKPSTILEVGGQRIGIVGATTVDLPAISNIGEHIKMKPIVAAMQKEVDSFTTQGINKIVVVSHCGYGEERELARTLKGVDVIVGGHSHTLVGTVQVGGSPMGTAPYPTVEKDPDGNTALVVQGWEWGKVVGNLRVTFDDAGHVKSWEGAPIKIDASIPEDPVFATIIEAFQKPLKALRDQKVGDSKIEITDGRGESPAGNLIADAMLEATASQGAVAAFMNAGGVRSGLPAGPLTYGTLIEMQPFNNSLTILELTGAEIKKALEHGVSVGGGFLHVSHGTAYVIDRSRPEGDRVTSITIAGQPVDPSKTYKVTFNSFTASGGDAHETLKAATGARTDTGILDIDALIDYVKAHSPIEPKVEGRIRS
jgi:5'-nucleotidase